jgi:hypothetical protein
MDHILNQIAQKFLSSEEDHRKLAHYVDMMKHPGWAVHQEMMLGMTGLIASDVLSKRFTAMTADEKDVQQRAYHYVYELIQFLLNPLARVGRGTAIKQHNIRMEESLKRPSTKKGQQK